MATLQPGPQAVDLNYIMLPQYMSINITKYFSIQLGGQIGFLLNAKADSSNQTDGSSSPYDDVMGYYNKFDYGYGGGIEIHPITGLLIGARFLYIRIITIFYTRDRCKK